MKKALVTGGAGFIGSHVVRGLLDDGWSVKVVDNLSTGKLDNVDDVLSKIELVDGDIRDGALMSGLMDEVDRLLNVKKSRIVAHWQHLI